MGTKQENSDKRTAHIAETEAQLKAWSTQLNDLVAGQVGASGQEDPYRIRLDGLRTRIGEVETKLTEFSSHPGGWGPFQASISEDWTALKAGFADLTR
jgi:hypothetical protein